MGTYVIVGPCTYKPPVLFCLDHRWTAQRCHCIHAIPQGHHHQAPAIVTLVGNEAVMGKYNFRVISTPFLTRLLRETGLASCLLLQSGEPQPITLALLAQMQNQLFAMQQTTTLTSYPDADWKILDWLRWWATNIHATYGDAAACAFAEIDVARNKVASA